jgi:hypothetical protein
MRRASHDINFPGAERSGSICLKPPGQSSDQFPMSFQGCQANLGTLNATTDRIKKLLEVLAVWIYIFECKPI